MYVRHYCCRASCLGTAPDAGFHVTVQTCQELDYYSGSVHD